MAVFRVEKTKDYTIMSNHHLKDRRLSLKAKGLLSMMLSLPKEWDYTLKGLARISREGVDAIREAVRELEQAGYVVRSRTRNPKGQLANAEYVIYEHPMPASRSAPKPAREKPVLENPTQEKPAQEDPTQLKKQESNTNPERTKPIASIHPILPGFWGCLGWMGWRISCLNSYNRRRDQRLDAPEAVDPLAEGILDEVVML